MNERYHVTVVIPTRERQASLRRLLMALAPQTLSAEHFEVVTVLNGADDGTATMIERLEVPYRLRYVRHPQPSRASACNHGAQVARGQLIVFLDDDMEPAEGLLRAHLDAHAAGDPRGVVGSAPIPLDTSSPPIVAYRARHFQRKLERMAATPSSLRFNQVYTGNFSIPRALFLEVGGFDETFTIYGCEDYELAVRLLKRGVRFFFSEQALARQHYTKDFGALARNTIAEGQNTVRFACKHPEIVADLRLRVPRRHRRLRSLMLLAGRVWRHFPLLVIGVFQRIEARRPARLASLYRFAFDYLYWHGVDTALGEMSHPRRAPLRLGKRLQRLTLPQHPPARGRPVPDEPAPA